MRPFLNWDLEIHYKKGFEMPTDFLGSNVVELIEVLDEDLAQLQTADDLCQAIKLPLLKEICSQELLNFKNQAEKLAPECFEDKNIRIRKQREHFIINIRFVRHEKAFNCLNSFC